MTDDRIDYADYMAAKHGRGVWRRDYPRTSAETLRYLRYSRELRRLYMAGEEGYDHDGADVITWDGASLIGPEGAGFVVTMRVTDDGWGECDDDAHRELDPADRWAPRGMARGPAWEWWNRSAEEVRAWLANESGDRHAHYIVSLSVTDPEGEETFAESFGFEYDHCAEDYGATFDMIGYADYYCGGIRDVLRDAVARYRSELRERAAYPDMVTA